MLLFFPPALSDCIQSAVPVENKCVWISWCREEWLPKWPLKPCRDVHWSQITEEDQVCPAVRVCMRMLQRTLNPLIYLIKTAVSLTHTHTRNVHTYSRNSLHKHTPSQAFFSFSPCLAARELKRPQIHHFFSYSSQILWARQRSWPPSPGLANRSWWTLDRKGEGKETKCVWV